MINDRTLPSSLALIALSLAAVAAYLPETSTRTMAASPLQPGEVAVVREAETATIYVGGETGSAMRVSEPTAIRGWRIEDIPADEISVVIGGDVIVSNGAYWVIGRTAKGTVAFTAKGGEKIYSHEMDEGHGEAGISPDVGWITTHQNGPELRIEIEPKEYGWMCVSNVVITRVAFGDVETANDLTRVNYTFIDDGGTWELGGLRNWVRHLYDGNRGADWSKYKAVAPVNLDKHAIMFDSFERYVMREDAATNLVMSAGGRDVMTVSFRGANVSANGFRITDVTVTDGTAYISYYADIDDFTVAGMGVKVKDKLSDDVWHSLSSGEFTATDSLVVIPAASSSSGSRFYKLTYSNIVSDVLEVRFAARVVLDNALILRGSGVSSNLYYRITVTNGTIYASETTL